MASGQGREPPYGRLWMHCAMRTKHVLSVGCQDRIHVIDCRAAKSRERVSNANLAKRRPFVGRWREHSAEHMRGNPRTVENDFGASASLTLEEVSIAFTQMGDRREDVAT